jgi:RDD family
MAVYDPPQPMWKRNVAAVLDFVLAAIVFGFLLTLVFGNPPSPASAPPGAHQLFGFGPIPSLLLLALIIAYFVVPGRAGGTVFQRLYGMKRA